MSKPLSEYYLDKRASGGRKTNCKSCVLDRVAEYHARNRDAIRTYKADYYLTNRDATLQRAAEYRSENPHAHWEHSYRQRAQQYGFGYLIPSMQSFTREELVWLHGDKCYHCGGEWTELDHWPLAISQGGMHALFNAVPSCLTCNRKSWRNRTTTQEKQHDR